MTNGKRPMEIVERADLACPLCLCEKNDPFFTDNIREYVHCPNCELIFVPKKYWLSLAEEKGVYDLHENDPEDLGYRRFLSRLTTPLFDRIGECENGLDFGCGPGPTLSVILEEQGHQVALYDPIYYPNSWMLQRKYDFICSTEVVEHLHNPNETFTLFFKMLEENGCIAIMTKLVLNKSAFEKWHYIRDMTHVCFYSEATFAYIAKRFNAEYEILGSDVILMIVRGGAA